MTNHRTGVYVQPEDLLRYVLQQPDVSTDDQPLYTFLLGSRLCISPHQLLINFQRIANDGTLRDDKSAPSSGECPVCQRKRRRRLESTASNNQNNTDDVDGKVTSFYSSTTTPGEETIRRRRRGRTPPSDEIGGGDGPTSMVSRDSGIVSAYYEEGGPPTSSTQEDGVTSSSSEAVVVVDESSDDVMETARCSCLRRRIVAVLHEWVRLFPTDFRNKKIMATLNDVIKSCQSEHEELARACTLVVDCVSRGIANQENYERVLCDADISQHDADLERLCLGERKNRDQVVKFIMSQKDATQVNEFARQLSLIELEFLKHVGAEELMQMFTSDGDEESRTNLGASVRWFNRLGYLVATVICMCRKRKHARHVITFFLRVADRCYELSNFNSAMSIWTGLTQEPVVRLKRTWSKLKLAEYKKLEKIFSPERNFREYRRVYFKRIERYLRHKLLPPTRTPTGHTGETPTVNRFSIISQRSSGSGTSTTSQPGDSGVECDQHDPHQVRSSSSSASSTTAEFKLPVTSYRTQSTTSSSSSSTPQKSEIIIPFLVLLMKDVYNLLNHTTPTTKEDGRINWEKLQRLSQILRPIEDWKRTHLAYQRNDVIRDFLINTSVWDVNELFLASYKREAPSCRAERDNLKQLKSSRNERRHCSDMWKSKTL